jgi:tripartite-type tricarboxylate transporter receptor subunit TctC
MRFLLPRGRLAGLAVIAIIAALSSGIAPAAAQIKQVVIYVAGTAGGGVDLYGRLVGHHLGRHLPGNPTVTVEDMPGAGGIKAANYLATVAAKDGSVMTTFPGGPIYDPLISARDTGYDMSKFTWVGAVSKDVSLCIAWAQTPFKTLDDVKRQQMVVAGTGAGSETDTWPVLLNELLGTKFKLVTGYLGSQETFLAMESGEAHGRCGLSYSSLKTAKPDWLPQKKITILAQIGIEANPEIAAPLLTDLLSKQEDKDLIAFLTAVSAMSRPFVAPPGLPADRAELLRRAFDATMKDPEFLAEAKKIKADVEPSTGEQVDALVKRLYATPKPVVERAKKFMAPG